jgi:hypothetical protein
VPENNGFKVITTSTTKTTAPTDVRAPRAAGDLKAAKDLRSKLPLSVIAYTGLQNITITSTPEKGVYSFKGEYASDGNSYLLTRTGTDLNGIRTIPNHVYAQFFKKRTNALTAENLLARHDSRNPNVTLSFRPDNAHLAKTEATVTDFRLTGLTDSTISGRFTVLASSTHNLNDVRAPVASIIVKSPEVLAATTAASQNVDNGSEITSLVAYLMKNSTTL